MILLPCVLSDTMYIMIKLVRLSAKSTIFFFHLGTPPSEEVPDGDCPFLVPTDDDPDIVVPIVHTHDFGKYLGRFDVTFDDDGRLIQWNGNPILLDEDVE